VLSLFAAAIDKLRELVAGDVLRVMEAVFECTLQMITRNFEDFPEHRLNFFRFLKARSFSRDLARRGSFSVFLIFFSFLFVFLFTR
jgi:hypothetical protein